MRGASNFAGQVDLLFWFITILAAIIAVGVFILIVVFAVRYRRRYAGYVPPAIEGNNRLEIAWIVIPTIIALATFAWAAVVYVHMYNPPQDATTIYVVGRQWMWKAQQPTGQWENNELHVPVGKPVKLVMTSQDVIHDFFIPAFRVKQDVIPGRYTTMWFTAEKPGVYDLFCAEYCGTSHSEMIGKVYAMSPQDYEAWLSGGTTSASTSGGAMGGSQASSQSAGQQLYQSLGCASCHGQNGEGNIGPRLAGLYGSQVQLSNGQTVTADDAYIRESILNPQAKIVKGYQPIMPTFQGQVTEQDILQLIQFIKSLGSSQGAAQGQGSTTPAASPTPAVQSGQ